MTVKRTRTSNDDAEADQSEVEQYSAPAKSQVNQLPSTTVAASPVQETTTAAESSNYQSKLGGFLEKCRYCRKRIPEGVEVFMYRDFCAYCSSGCRNIQISLDKLAERHAIFAQERVVKTVKSHSVAASGRIMDYVGQQSNFYKALSSISQVEEVVNVGLLSKAVFDLYPTAKLNIEETGSG